ncbi:unnamed protein product [Gadus morhua 'NCC']
MLPTQSRPSSTTPSHHHTSISSPVPEAQVFSSVAPACPDGKWPHRAERGPRSAAAPALQQGPRAGPSGGASGTVCVPVVTCPLIGIRPQHLSHTRGRDLYPIPAKASVIRTPSPPPSHLRQSVTSSCWSVSPSAATASPPPVSTT